ncbi:MAG: hypothetical protein R3B06_25205 [Kofleriaceae bacterium]
MTASTSWGAWLVALVSVAGCGKPGGAPAGAPGGGLASVDDVGRALDEALALGAKTWPGARVRGVLVGPAVPLAEFKARSVHNVYTARVSFGAAAGQPAAGSVECYPTCTVVPPGKLTPTPGEVTPPCAFPEALAAARRAGLTATQPVITFGSWADQHRTGWVFQATHDAPPIEIDEGCRDAADRPPPAAPGNGAPVAFVVRSVTPGARVAGSVTVKGYNFSTATLATLGVAARFFDQAGAPLKVKIGTPFEQDVAWTTLSGSGIRCAPRSWCTFRLFGLEVPAATARAEVALTSATALAADGHSVDPAPLWKSPAGMTAWPL